MHDVLDNKEKNQWLQFNAGVRSQRFALVVEDGVVRAAVGATANTSWESYRFCVLRPS